MTDEQPTIKELVAALNLADAEMKRVILGVGSGSNTLAEAEEAIRECGRAGYELECAKGRRAVDEATEGMIKQLREKYAAVVADSNRGYVKGFG